MDSDPTDQPPPYEALEDAPPSYTCAAVGDSVFAPRLSKLRVIDFLPDEDSRFPKDTRFSHLVGKANDWLYHNKTWEAKTCESVVFRCKEGIPQVHCVTFVDEAEKKRLFGIRLLRGLRLWIVPRRSPNLPPQSLAFFDTVPKHSKSRSCIKFQKLDEVLQDVNIRLTAYPINGTIISVETQPMKYSSSKGTVDPDQTYFKDYGFSVFVIRVFYEEGPPAKESIEMTDFLPSIHKCPIDSVSTLVKRASERICCRPGVRICSIHTIGMRRKPGNDKAVNSNEMSRCQFHEDDDVVHGRSRSGHYARILRLFYLTTSQLDLPIDFLKHFTGPLTCKTFLPVQLTSKAFNGRPLFETIQQTFIRISAWVKEHNVHVVSAETCPIRMYSGARCFSPDSTHYYESIELNETFIYVVRLYLDGHYPDPHISMTAISYQGWKSAPIRDAEQIHECVGGTDIECSVI